MEIVVFKIQPRADIDQRAYQEAFEKMLSLVAEVPGFIGIQGFAGEDGSELALASFDSPEAIAAWRDHPEHVRTRERGRHEFFESYEITIASVWRKYEWRLGASAPSLSPAAGED